MPRISDIQRMSAPLRPSTTRGFATCGSRLSDWSDRMLRTNCAFSGSRSEGSAGSKCRFELLASARAKTGRGDMTTVESTRRLYLHDVVLTAISTFELHFRMAANWPSFQQCLRHSECTRSAYFKISTIRSALEDAGHFSSAKGKSAPLRPQSCLPDPPATGSCVTITNSRLSGTLVSSYFTQRLKQDKSRKHEHGADSRYLSGQFTLMSCCCSGGGAGLRRLAVLPSIARLWKPLPPSITA